MAASCADGCERFAPAEMAVNAKLLLTLLFEKVDVHIKMLEVTAKDPCDKN